MNKPTSPPPSPELESIELQSLELTSTENRRAWLEYRSVWRWHFYASLFCMPFVIFLSITGGIYLFKPQIDRWTDRKYDGIHTQDAVTEREVVSIAKQVESAVAAFPGSVPSAYELPRESNQASRILLKWNGKTMRTFVDPTTGEVLGSRPDDATLSRQIRSLHGQLNLGTRGSNLVELAACWTLIMVITGLYLWWPRSLRGWGGVLFPRLRKGSKVFWRDIHSVTGIWISLFAIFLITTGLPWAKFWGSYFRSVRELTGTSAVTQDWTLGGKPVSIGSHEHAGHASGSHESHEGGRKKRNAEPVFLSDLASFDRIAKGIESMKLAYPATIVPPSKGSTQWTVKSEAQNRTLRVTMQVNGDTGAIHSQERFADKPFLDRMVSVGISAHEGQLFGWANQLLGLITVLGLILLSMSGYVLWWRRREPGKLGAPKRLIEPRFRYGLLAIVAMLALAMPLFGFSLVVVRIIEWGVLSRVPAVRDWMGLVRVTS